MTPKVKSPPCPAFLGRIGRREWRRQVAELESLGVIATIDRAALAVWCDTWQEYLVAIAMIRKHGRQAVGSTGQMVVSPWFRAKATAAERLLKYAAQFGFTPSARARINAVEVAEEDKFGDFLDEPVAGKVG